MSACRPAHRPRGVRGPEARPRDPCGPHETMRERAHGDTDLPELRSPLLRRTLGSLAMTAISLLVGTRKGAFILRRDEARTDWRVEGPHCQIWPVNHVIADAAGTVYAAAGNEWFGPAVWKSTDGGKTWTDSSKGLAYPEGSTPIKSAWSLAAGHDRLWCGVEPAGLFRSDDGGETWEHVEGLQQHPSRDSWVPRAGGLILHHIALHPTDPDQVWVSTSTAGVFHMADGGKTWEARNKGVRCDDMPEDQRYPETGQCVHGLAMAPGMPNRIYQQNHCGMYRSDDGGRSCRASRRACPPPSAFRSQPTRAIPSGSTSRRSTATSRGATCRTREPPCGVRMMPARPGGTAEPACRSETPSSTCCARRWPRIR